MWTCTICSKQNDLSNEKCKVCGRKKGTVSKVLPFHPTYKPVRGARVGLKTHEAIALLEAGADPNQRDASGWSSMHWATALGRLDLVAAYVKHGAQINCQANDGKTPLHIACEMSNVDVCLYLIQRGADWDLRSGVDGLTALHVAAQNNSNTCIEALGLAGVDLNITSLHGKFTALYLAALGGHEESVNSLINVSRDPMRTGRGLATLILDIEDVDGWTPYRIAKLKGYENIVTVLERAGAKQVLDHDFVINRYEKLY